jgi:predicted restriction endonuclease
MNGIRPEVVRIRLDLVSYENLRQEVLRRDGWRCQSCGAMSNLESTINNSVVIGAVIQGRI